MLIVLYTWVMPKGNYDFMKETHVYIFRCETVYIDLQCFIIDKSWHVCDSVMQLVRKPGTSVV